MQWSDAPNAGFSSGHPWLPVPASSKSHNVAAEMADPDSVLQFYRRLLELRHTEGALLDGKYVALNPDDAQVLSYLRRSRNEAVVVVLNMSGQRQHVRLDLEAQGLGGRAQILATTLSGVRGTIDLADVDLEPFGVVVGRVGHRAAHGSTPD